MVMDDISVFTLLLPDIYLRRNVRIHLNFVMVKHSSQPRGINILCQPRGCKTIQTKPFSSLKSSSPRSRVSTALTSLRRSSLCSRGIRTRSYPRHSSGTPLASSFLSHIALSTFSILRKRVPQHPLHRKLSSPIQN